MNHDLKLAYCTNVHAGSDLASVRSNLDRYALAVRRSLVDSNDWGDEESLGIGLWLADSAAREALEGDRADRLADWLRENRLLPFTFNGFPQNNFHQTVVKHRVYEPTWWQIERFEYTQRLIHLLDRLLPPNQLGSISTLPIAWSVPSPSQEQLLQAASHLKQLAIQLDRLMQERNREIVIAIEPEPGCAITDGKSMRSFFEQYLLDDSNRELIARHIGVCHDVCHAAVMRENQANELTAYRRLGIRIGKVQISSAIDVDWGSMEASMRPSAFQHLTRFAEDRYLHQTTVIDPDREGLALHEDLPKLLESIREPELLREKWRIHFHVPIFLKNAGPLGTTQSDIEACLNSTAEIGPKVNFFPSYPAFTGHLEVETYAWGVLPEQHRSPSLSEDIAAELRFLRALVQKKVFP